MKLIQTLEDPKTYPITRKGGVVIENYGNVKIWTNGFGHFNFRFSGVKSLRECHRAALLWARQRIDDELRKLDEPQG